MLLDGEKRRDGWIPGFLEEILSCSTYHPKEFKKSGASRKRTTDGKNQQMVSQVFPAVTDDFLFHLLFNPIV